MYVNCYTLCKITSYVEQARPSDAEGFFYSGTNVRGLRLRPGQRFLMVLSETGSDHLHVIAEEASRVANVLRNKSDAARAYNIEAVKIENLLYRPPNLL